MHHSYDYVRALRSEREQAAAHRRFIGEVAAVEPAAAAELGAKREQRLRRTVVAVAAATLIIGLSVPSPVVDTPPTPSTTTTTV